MGRPTKIAPSVHPILRILLQEADRQGFTRQGLAQRAGYDRASVYNWACGNIRPSIHNLDDLATTLGLRIAAVPVAGPK